MKEYSVMLKNMFRFEGRTRRREYWVCSLINAAIRSVFVVIMIFGATVAREPLFYATGTSMGFNTKGHFVATILFVLFACVHIFLFVSMLGMTIRRYHDAGLPGWVYPICLVGIVFCCIGAIAHLVICFLPSKEDNQYGQNPKNAETNEYENPTSIVIAIVLLIVAYAVVIIASVCNTKICGLNNENRGRDIFTETPEVTTDDDSWMDTEEPAEVTDTEAIVDLTEADIDDSGNTDAGDDYGDGAIISF